MKKSCSVSLLENTMSRVYCSQLRNRIMLPEDASNYIKPGMTVAFGGISSAGYPKAIPQELHKRRAAGEDLNLFMVSGTAIHQIDDWLSESVTRRTPMFESKAMRTRINSGKIHYVEQQIGKSIRLLHTGAYGKIDVAVVEALLITEDCALVPTSSVCYLPHFLELADKVIIEVNSHLPLGLEGYHDIYVPGLYPNRAPIPLYNIRQRIGSTAIKLDPEKVVAIVETNCPDAVSAPVSKSDALERIADNLILFLQKELTVNWKTGLPPVQTGIGSLAKSIVSAFDKADFRHLQFFCGALHDSHMRLLEKGRVEALSASSVELSDDMAQLLSENSQELQQRLILRNTDMINEAELLQRFGILALNSALEIDIYGNVNQSHIAGTNVVNGLGGGAQFAQNAGLSVLLIPSTSKQGAISSVVPMVSHVDITEHDIDVVITEQGIADLRNKDEQERAHLIIENCASPQYQDALKRYLRESAARFSGHHPQDPIEASQWHRRLAETGTMMP